MTPLRWTLVALLVVSTALFAAGVIAERSEADAHTEATVGESAEEHESDHGDEAVLDVDVESTPVVVLAVIGGLALAVLAATRLGELSGVLIAIALVALAWAALDVREVIHQAGESRTGVALIATGVAVLHLAAAAVSPLSIHRRRAPCRTRGG